MSSEQLIRDLELYGYSVIEIGIRQAWPFVKFASSAEGDHPEIRLNIDSGFTVTGIDRKGSSGEEDDDELWVRRLLEVNNLTVQHGRIEPDASLVLTFDDGVCLRVNGSPAPWTTQDVWSLVT
ncbi:MAG: hypothetical protein ABIS86_06805 [Streptosporangiaceae bacterium]